MAIRERKRREKRINVRGKNIRWSFFLPPHVHVESIEEIERENNTSKVKGKYKGGVL